MLKKSSIGISFLMVFQLSGSCDKLFKTQEDSYFLNTASSNFHYDLSNPKNKYFMGFELEEISGISWYRNRQLGCIQDEEGKIFFYDLKKEKVVRRIKFHKSGDYEGVEIIDEEAFVIRSDGQLFKFSIGKEDKKDSQKIDTRLDRENDVEGLGYDPNTNSLIIACKGSGSIKGNKVKGRAVYSFDPKTQRLGIPHLFAVSKKDMEKFVKDAKWEDKSGLKISPSGIAVHPKEGRYYIISSSGKFLLILNRQYGIDELIRLHPKVFRQPEGICFAPNGDMFISSEGNGGDGYILEFLYQKKPFPKEG